MRQQKHNLMDENINQETLYEKSEVYTNKFSRKTVHYNR
jgi:hypothetical protein